MRSSSEAPRRVVLFDVDGTLVHAAGAGRRSLARVLEGEFGRVDHALSGLRLDGMTDRLIVREVLACLGRPFEDALTSTPRSGVPSPSRSGSALPDWRARPSQVASNGSSSSSSRLAATVMATSWAFSETLISW